MITLKIGKYNYAITEKDEFMDNGSCVQLLTQSQEKGEWGHIPSPTLSKRAIKEISVFTRKQIPNDHGTKVQVFSLTRGIK